MARRSHRGRQLGSMAFRRSTNTSCSSLLSGGLADSAGASVILCEYLSPCRIRVEITSELTGIHHESCSHAGCIVEQAESEQADCPPPRPSWASLLHEEAGAKCVAQDTGE